MYAKLIALAALWGVLAGLLLPRAAYRLSVAPDEDWRDTCPSGHPFTGGVRGWAGGVRCVACAPAVRAGPTRTAEALAPTDATDDTASAGTAPGTAPGPTDDTASAGTAPGTAPGPTDDTAPAGTAPGTAAFADGPAPTGPRTVRSGPYVPLVTALVSAALAAATGPRPELAVWLLLMPFAVLLALVDRAVHRLPDRLTLPLAAAAAVLLAAAAPLPGAAGSWTGALLGGLVLGAAYFVLFVVHPHGMGFGDVKLALSLGGVLGWYGWAVLFLGAFAGFVFGSLYGLGLILLRRADRRTAIPFGPFMIAGALAGLLLGALSA